MKKQMIMLALMVGGISQLNAVTYSLPVYLAGPGSKITGYLPVNGNFLEGGICRGASWAPGAGTPKKGTLYCTCGSGVGTSLGVSITNTDNEFVTYDGESLKCASSLVGGIKSYEIPVYIAGPGSKSTGNLPVNGNFLEGGICRGASWAPGAGTPKKGTLYCTCGSGAGTSLGVSITNTDNEFVTYDGESLKCASLEQLVRQVYNINYQGSLLDYLKNQGSFNDSCQNCSLNVTGMPLTVTLSCVCDGCKGGCGHVRDAGNYDGSVIWGRDTSLVVNNFTHPIVNLDGNLVYK